MQGAVNPRASVEEGAAEALEPDWKRPDWLEVLPPMEVLHITHPRAEVVLVMLHPAVVGLDWKQAALLEVRPQMEVVQIPRPRAKAALDMPHPAAAVGQLVGIVACNPLPRAALLRH
jgi:hypothetical protein